MGKITWLASYPKSGNTWFRIFLTFFRKGKIGDWRNVLLPEQAQAVITAHRAVMRRLGYLTTADELVF